MPERLHRPDFVIIGAMKSATSTLHDQLALQPGISMSEPKEPNFFSDEENWSRGLAWYRSLFESMPADHLVGESSTHYTKLPTYPLCADRLHAALPGARLVYVMRDPVARIVSQYVHEWSVLKIAKDCPIDDAVRRHPGLVEYSKYDTQIAPYLERFGREAVLPVFFERLVRDPQTEFERICRHVRYAGRPTWIVEEAPRNASVERLRKPPAVRAVLEIGWLKTVRRVLLPEAVRRRIRSTWAMPDRPKLGPEALQLVRAQLDPDLVRLGARFGRPMTCATYQEAVLADGPPTW